MACLSIHLRSHYAVTCTVCPTISCNLASNLFGYLLLLTECVHLCSVWCSVAVLFTADRAIATVSLIRCKTYMHRESKNMSPKFCPYLHQTLMRKVWLFGKYWLIFISANERSETGGYTVFTFVCLHVCAHCDHHHQQQQQQTLIHGTNTHHIYFSPPQRFSPNPSPSPNSPQTRLPSLTRLLPQTHLHPQTHFPPQPISFPLPVSLLKPISLLPNPSLSPNIKLSVSQHNLWLK